MTNPITSSLPYDVQPVSLITSDDSIRRTLGRHRLWIEQTLSVSFEDAVFLRLDFDLTGIAVNYICGTTDQPAQSIHLRRIRSRVESVDTPHTCTPLVSFGDPDAESGSLHRLLGVAPPLREVAFTWRDCPIAIKLEGIPYPVVLQNVGYVATLASRLESTAHIMITPKVQIREVLRFLAFVDSAEHRARIHIMNGPTRSVARLAWDDLVLDDAIVHLLKDDFESFWARENWFCERKLPLQEGYLLHGPPGNGTTSTICAMMSSRKSSQRYPDRGAF